MICFRAGVLDSRVISILKAMRNNYVKPSMILKLGKLSSHIGREIGRGYYLPPFCHFFRTLRFNLSDLSQNQGDKLYLGPFFKLKIAILESTVNFNFFPCHIYSRGLDIQGGGFLPPPPPPPPLLSHITTKERILKGLTCLQ